MEEKEEKRLRLEQELGVRELTPQEIQGIFNNEKELGSKPVSGLRTKEVAHIL